MSVLRTRLCDWMLAFASMTGERQNDRDTTKSSSGDAVGSGIQ